MNDSAKSALYSELQRDITAVLEGISDDVTAMATYACLLHGRLSLASWVGFYRVVAPGLLRVGPYQGPLGCLEIPFGQGVCGTAAQTRTTQLVPDVHLFPGHIACDAAARSEIVVPILDARGDLVAVLDVDSHSPSAFDEVDKAGLENLATCLRDFLSTTAAPSAPS